VAGALVLLRMPSLDKLEAWSCFTNSFTVIDETDAGVTGAAAASGSGVTGSTFETATRGVSKF
jgi:hypothetical protein